MRLQIQKLVGTRSEQHLEGSISSKSGSYFMGEFMALENAGFTQEFVSLNKTEQTFDLYALRIRTFDNEPEHWGTLKPPEDWPGPEYVGLINIEGTWYQTTLIGAANLANCDIDATATSVKVYDANAGPPPGNVAPQMGIIKMETEEARYKSRSATSFNELTRGIYDVHTHQYTGAGSHHGHDMGAQSPGPPPVPPDTAHDPVFIKAFSTSLMHFVAQANEQTAMLMRPISYVPSGSKHGIFMPIIMRYLADRWITKTVTKTVTRLVSKTLGAPPVAVPDPSIIPRPEEIRKVTPGGGAGFGSPIDSTADEGETQRESGEQPDRNGPGGFLML